MTEKFSFDVNEKDINNFKEVIYDEFEVIHKRFENGTETEKDLLCHVPHYKIKCRMKNGKEEEFDIVETKYYEKLVDLVKTKDTEIQQVLDDYQELGKDYHKLECESEKKDTEINKLNRALDEMANTLDLNFSLSVENYKFGKKEEIKEYFMKQEQN